MTGHFLDNTVTKDDCLSMASSMSDSAYMSLPDLTQAPPGFVPGFRKGAVRDFKRPVLDSSLGSDMYSPTLSSHSSSTFHRSSCGMTQVLLPQAEGLTVQSAYRIPQLANIPPSHVYDDTAGFDLRRNTVPGYLGSEHDIGSKCDVWLGDRARDMGESFIGSPLSVASNSLDKQMSEPLLAPPIGCLDSTLVETSSDLSQLTAERQSRICGLLHGSNWPSTTPLERPASVNNTYRDSRISVVPRRTSSTIPSNLTADAASVPSPTLSAMSHPRIYNLTAQGFMGTAHVHGNTARYFQFCRGKPNATSTLNADEAIQP